jgi:nucleoside phosphorylase
VTHSSATVATNLRHSYRNIGLALLVGICGGVPKTGNTEILLGDVIISDSVVEYDHGRQYPHGFRRKERPKGNLNGPNKEIRSLLAMLKTEFWQTLAHK